MENPKIKAKQLLLAFISGRDRSTEIADEIWAAVRATAPENEELQELIDDLASYTPGGGDYLFAEREIQRRCEQALLTIDPDCIESQRISSLHRLVSESVVSVDLTPDFVSLQFKSYRLTVNGRPVINSHYFGTRSDGMPKYREAFDNLVKQSVTEAHSLEGKAIEISFLDGTLVHAPLISAKGQSGKLEGADGQLIVAW
jgi:hypothetical protein